MNSLGFTPRHHDHPTTEAEQISEWAMCAASPIYFIGAYCWLFNATVKDWVPFDLWPAQAWALNRIHAERQIVALKARQLGFTWLWLAYQLWQMILHPSAAVGIFSRTEGDAQGLLDFRLKGMYERLPPFLRAKSVEKGNMSEWRLSNGSYAKAFATTGGRGETFSHVLVDEADYQPDIDDLMRAVKPTIDAGGQIALLSTVDKGVPTSLFKTIYTAAKKNSNEWYPLFLPWNARPERTPDWYESQRRDIEANTGSLDDLYQEYPATDAEALSPRQLDKRLPFVWLNNCYVESRPLPLPSDAPALDMMEVYAEPFPRVRYILGADPAEGNPTSDDSAASIVRLDTGEEVAAIAGKFEPSVFAAYTSAMATYYNDADLMAERNNHGHAVLMWWLDHAPHLRVLWGHDDKPGWLSSRLGKVMLYDNLADTLRAGNALIRSQDTFAQLASIEGATLRAPEGLHDDCADRFALADVGRVYALVADERDGGRHVEHEEDVRVSPY